MISLFILQTALPLAMIFWLAVWPPQNRVGFWALVLAATLIILLAGLLGIWLFPPFWVPYLMALLLVCVVIRHLVRANMPGWLPKSAVDWLGLVVALGIAGSAGAFSWTGYKGRQMPDGPAVDLAWPLAPGSYLVANGGSTPSVNAHAALLDPLHDLHAGFGGSGYGVDLISVNGWGFRANAIMPTNPTRYLIFGTPVLAPCAARVVLAVDGRPDNLVPQIDEGHPAGNHVLLRCANADILLGHFRQASLRISAGDTIVAGQQLGEVGNSGESSEPHLHIHAQTHGTADAPFSGAAIPIRFEGRFLVRNERVDTR